MDLDRQELEKIYEQGYGFYWKGKGQAVKDAENDEEGFIDFYDGNLYIEGDNLIALKRLQKEYKGKIKMIYIDPPYNTKKKFIYNDIFTKRKKESLSQGDRLHSNWLNMMYPRLKLARNLLTDDGVIFISIDDNEVTNLKKICDEIFGENNILGLLPWKKKQGGGNDSKFFVQEHEYILCIANNIEKFEIGLDKFHKLDDNLYPFKDEKGDYGLVTLDKSSIRFSESLVFEIKDRLGNSYFPRIVKGKQSCWRWGKEKVEKDFDELVFKDGKVYTKYRRPEGVPPRSLLIDTRFGRTEVGKEEVKDILGDGEFSYPKPIGLIKHFIHLIPKKNFIILDFFSGSATTAHAVMQLNAEDGGNRKYIMVQLPEVCDEKSEAYKAGYKNICEIGKERIRRAGEKIKSDETLPSENREKLDIGFKVIKL